MVEIDIKASHLALVYALKGVSPNQHFRAYGADGYWSRVDPYAVEGLPRRVVKAWVTATLGAGRPPRRWSPATVAELREEQGIDLRAYPVRQVGAAVLQRHPVLGDLTGVTWARLQFLESEAIVRALLRLQRGHAIPALPVHDSLIVPRPAWWVANDILREELMAATGFPPLTFDFTPPVRELPGPWSTRYAHLLERPRRPPEESRPEDL